MSSHEEPAPHQDGAATSTARSEPQAPWRHNSFLLLQDSAPPLGPRGQLSNLIRNRSHTSLQQQGVARRGSGIVEPHDLEAMIESPGGAEDAHWRSGTEERRLSAILHSQNMRSMRLIGSSNPRYRWERYWKTDDELKKMRKPIREYYERTNYLVQQYLYIDRLLDSNMPHDLLNEYNYMTTSNFRGVEVPDTISEEPTSAARSTTDPDSTHASGVASPVQGVQGSATSNGNRKVKRTPKDIYGATETSPLLSKPNGGRDGSAEEYDDAEDDEENGDLPPKAQIPWLEGDDDLDSSDPIVTFAIYINFAANAILLAGKIAVIISVSSMSVLASLVDATLDFLSTVIVWTTTWLISRQDQYKYPVGRRRLEPLGVLVFSIIMITSFVQVALQSLQRLASSDHEIVELGIPAIGIMAGTIFIKGLCWLWCRFVKNSSVQALADDAMTDVIFNTGSILFPIVGFYAHIWWLDALGGLLLSLVVIINWSKTSGQHIKNLSGFSATADERNVLLYLTMRFAKTIRQIQGLQAYHSGDKLNVEVDIVLDASTPLRDSHDLSESLGYVLESVPVVDRAFVHADYATYNLPTHMQQQQQQARA